VVAGRPTPRDPEAGRQTSCGQGDRRAADPHHPRINRASPPYATLNQGNRARSIGIQAPGSRSRRCRPAPRCTRRCPLPMTS